jgi:hypothetical protein
MVGMEGMIVWVFVVVYVFFSFFVRGYGHFLKLKSKK